MIDREKVIKALEHCKDNQHVNDCEECDYGGKTEMFCIRLIDDVLSLLKEKEPILLENQHKPYGVGTNANSPWISRCPRCGKKVEGKQTRFCKYCGQAVKFE